MKEYASPGPQVQSPPEVTPVPSAPVETTSGLGSVALADTDFAPMNSFPVAMQEALIGVYGSMEDRITTNPVPTEQELQLGVFAEEIQPQVRGAALLMHIKGYGVGNVASAGFTGENFDTQSMQLATPLPEAEATRLKAQGFAVEDNVISFRPEPGATLSAIQGTWDWLATNLPPLDEPPKTAMFGNAVAFREAVNSGTLLDYYYPNDILDLIGTKYVRDRDPHARHEVNFSDDPANRAREVTFITMYHELQDRLATNPTPTAEELSMGAYREQLEPQVRDAVMLMRAKGYNTGSSGFYGQERDQVIDLAASLDSATRERLAELGVQTTSKSIRFSPEDYADLDAIKMRWDTIAQALPDMGKPADPSPTVGSEVFRYVTQDLNTNYDFLEGWVWQQGALNGLMHPLTQTLLNEGYSFGADVEEPARRAQASYERVQKAALARQN